MRTKLEQHPTLYASSSATSSDETERLPSMKIFIAGCGRSGTTLTRDLFNCFEDTFVLVEGLYGEAPVSRFASLTRPESHLVIKRTGECWQTLAALPDDVELLYCVRHPFDTLTSTHPLSKQWRRFHIDTDRWKSEYLALRALRTRQPQRRIFVLRYEALTQNPDSSQEKIAAHFGLIPTQRFSANMLGIQISAASIEKWKREREFVAYLETISFRYRLLMREFCDEFGYELPSGYVSWWRYLGRKVSNALAWTRLRG